MNTRSQWIWLQDGEHFDQYAEFYDSFVYEGETVTLSVSADSNYAVFVNGVLAAFGQYPDFPHNKVYDEVDLPPFCHEGKNHLGIQVWYYGEGTYGYYPGRAALRYEVKSNGALCAFSCEKTLSRQSPGYANDLCKKITHQLGYSFKADLTAQDEGWKLGQLNGFRPSVTVDQNMPMRLRPCERPKLKESSDSVLVKQDGATHFLYDLGREEVGFLTVNITSSCEQEVRIAFGEHIADGGVRRLISDRDFSVVLRLQKGRNEYLNPFRRLGLRYLELFCENPVEVHQLSVRPVWYPVQYTAEKPVMDDLQSRIYDVCVRTLELCMHDHYEDTPWREQALYAMDSRNQMLCGYDVFGEFAFARANLLLMSHDEREDGLLSICTPSKDNLTIPSFSFHYFTAVKEYTQRSGDWSLAREIWPKLKRLMDVFVQRLEENLLPVFQEKHHWNFYEWSDGLSGRLFQWDDKRFDAALNALLVTALKNMQYLADGLNILADYSSTAEKISHAMKKTFFDEARHVWINSTEDSQTSQLVNALAILCGASKGDEARLLAHQLTEPSNGMTPATLSMQCFVYDALLMVDEECYSSYVLEDIRRKYEKMLNAGATSFWETEKGESDFDNAGSLCHGWSALPVYYYHRLLAKK